MPKFIPNLLSILRILLSLLLLPLAGNRPVLMIIFACCGITDILDGYLARKYRAETRIGAYLDSISDFIFFWITLLYLALHHAPLLRSYAALIAAIAAVRFLSLIVCRVRNRKAYILHTLANKLSGLAVFVCIGLIMLRPIGPVITSILAFVLLSAAEELLIMLTVPSPDVNRRSLFFQ